jgi:DNA-binding LacI/PurR family transcriptional regulator
MPIVAIQAVSRAATTRIDVVHVDYQCAFQQAIEHLMQLGHRHIAYLGPVNAITPIDLYKYRGWKAAAKSAGLNPDYQIPWNVERIKSRRMAQMDELMSQTKIQQAVFEAAADCVALSPRPSAVVCASDEVAICLQSYLLAKGWNLPRDLSIVGYDGIMFGALVYPALSTIEPDFDRMADAAINRLLELMSRDKDGLTPKPQEVFIRPKLVIRGSTAPPAMESLRNSGNLNSVN